MPRACKISAPRWASTLRANGPAKVSTVPGRRKCSSTKKPKPASTPSGNPSRSKPCVRCLRNCVHLGHRARPRTHLLHGAHRLRTNNYRPAVQAGFLEKVQLVVVHKIYNHYYLPYLTAITGQVPNIAFIPTET